jgi:ElaB/YqjD/DUF883 family membrane-anchored ribosome-binding protein
MEREMQRPSQKQAADRQTESQKKDVATGEELLKQAREAADATAQSASRITQDVKTSVEDTASEIGSSLADKAGEAGREAAHTVRDVAERGRSHTQKYVRSIGKALEAGSRSLEDDGFAGTAGYVSAAGRGLEYAADEIKDLNDGGFTERVETFVRDRPIITVGVLALAGFALASTLKTSKGPAASGS